MTGNILLNDRPLIVVPTLAVTIGLNESIILQQIHYWLQRSKHIYLDRKWVYLTYDEFVEQIPFFSKSTIRRTIAKLENAGYLSSNNFNKLRMDKTKWYSINYEVLSELKLDEKEVEEDYQSMPSKMNGTVDISTSSVHSEQDVCSNAAVEVPEMNNLYVQSEQKRSSTRSEEMVNLNTPIPEVSTEITTKITSENSSSSSKDLENEDDPLQFFEQNGFGMIGKFIEDKINTWCGKVPNDLVIEAMKLAIENGAQRWNYVDAVLLDWVNKGIQTVEDIHEDRLAYKHYQQKKHTLIKPIRQELLPEWFNSENPQLEPEQNKSFAEKKRRFEEQLKKSNIGH
ncbi:DnaD domain-containing protein [Ferdinandcohnia sp. Marseille-Q9671]